MSTEVVQVPPSSGEIVDIADFDLPPLTLEEDNFCLAVIEYGGNLAQAYRAAYTPFAKTKDLVAPVARARALLAQPKIALRIKDLTETIAENTLISIGSHLTQLAEIRDLAKSQSQLKVALQAEEARGRVVGLYIGKDGGKSQAPAGGTVVMVSVTTASDRSI